jgi:hypothetical protein
MIGTGADNSDADAVSFVPTGIAIDDIDAVSCVEIVDRSFAIDLPDLSQ